MRTLFFALLFLASVIGGTLGTELANDEHDPCTDPNVNCARIFVPVG